MKKHYDFSKAQKGRLYRPAKALRIPIYLDEDLQRKLLHHGRRGANLTGLVNEVLRTQIGVANMLR